MDDLQKALAISDFIKDSKNQVDCFAAFVDEVSWSNMADMFMTADESKKDKDQNKRLDAAMAAHDLLTGDFDNLTAEMECSAKAAAFKAGIRFTIKMLLAKTGM